MSDKSFGVKQINLIDNSGTPTIESPGNLILNAINVGIGTTNPQYDVDVLGDINFTGSLYQNGTPFISGGGGSWASTDVGIHTLSDVGIGTTNPQAKLDVYGDVNISGVVTATSFSGSGSSLTGLTGASANIYGNGTAVPQITIDANGRITSVTNVTITGGASAGSGVNVDDNDSYVGFAGTINFGSGLSVSPLSATGVVTVTSFGGYWEQSGSGIHTSSSVGIGSTTPQAKLDVSPIGVDGISIGSTLLSMDITGNGLVSSLDVSRFMLGGVPSFVSIRNDTNTAGINFTPNTHSRQTVGSPTEFGSFSIFAHNPSNLYATDFINSSSDVNAGMNFGTGGSRGFTFFRVNENGAVAPTEIAGINTSGTLSCSGANFSTDSSDTAVRITQTGTGNALLVEDETNPDLTPVVISATGRVGIGTTNPSNTRYVSSYTQLVVSGGANGQRNGITIDGYTTPSIAFQGKFVEAENSIRGYLRYNPFSSASSILLDDSQTILGRGFSIAPSETTVVAITSSLLATSSNIDVGIGTTNPQTKLDVRGDVKVGIDTSEGVILTSPNGTQYRLIVDDSGNLSTVSV